MLTTYLVAHKKKESNTDHDDEAEQRKSDAYKTSDLKFKSMTRKIKNYTLVENSSRSN